MFQKPNYTQVPNEFFDVMAKDLSEAELRVFLAIARKTFGWSKRRDKISLSQLEKMTGLSRQSVLEGLNGRRGKIGSGLVEKKIVTCYQNPSGNEYEIVVQEDGVVNHVDQQEGLASQPSRLELVNHVDPQKKSLKETKNNTHTGLNKGFDFGVEHEEPAQERKRPKVENNPPSLHKKIEKIFEEKFGRFTNYAKEGKNIKRFCEAFEKIYGDAAESNALAVVALFWDLIQKKEFGYGDLEFTPSKLMLKIDNLRARLPKSYQTREASFKSTVKACPCCGGLKTQSGFCMACRFDMSQFKNQAAIEEHKAEMQKEGRV